MTRPILSSTTPPENRPTRHGATMEMTVLSVYGGIIPATTAVITGMSGHLNPIVTGVLTSTFIGVSAFGVGYSHQYGSYRADGMTRLKAVSQLSKDIKTAFTPSVKVDRSTKIFREVIVGGVLGIGILAGTVAHDTNHIQPVIQKSNATIPATP